MPDTTKMEAGRKGGVEAKRVAQPTLALKVRMERRGSMRLAACDGWAIDGRFGMPIPSAKEQIAPDRRAGEPLQKLEWNIIIRRGLVDARAAASAVA
jgi:hypothetical protein